MECNKILIAVDYSDFSYKSAIKGSSFAKKFKADIGIIFVIEPAKVAITPELGYMATNFVDQSKQEVEEMMSKLVEDIKKQVYSKMNIDKHIEFGSPSQKIIEVAEKWQADMIWMGTHGRSGLMHLLMGSVTQAVIQQAKIPVLAFPTKSLSEEKKKD